MSLKFFLTVITFCICFSSRAQTNIETERNATDTSARQKNHYVTYQFGYTNSPVGKTFGAKGFMSTIGFNIGKFFSNTIVLGPVADLKVLPGFGFFNLSTEFLNDFNANYIKPNTADSSNAEVMYVNMNSSGIHTYGFRGSALWYYGIMFSLFPHKAGGIMIQLKKGSDHFFAHQLVFENAAVPNISGYDKYPFTVSNNWKCEITCKPYAFFHDAYIDVRDFYFNCLLKGLSITVYYEKMNFANADYNGTKFSAFMSDRFMKKYAVDNRFGFKLAFSLY